MRVLEVRNVHCALPEAMRLLRESGIARDSRNGPVLQYPGPVTTKYRNPTERVLFWPERNANPFFHLFECIWMMAGRADVEWIAQFNSGITAFSDDGRRFHGAYGRRWRDWFEDDQLPKIIEALRNNPEDRRQVLAMWDANSDLGSTSKDIPCNTHIYFQRRASGELDMLVSNRSNDIVWGCYGANAVHFSFLQEFMAGAIGCPVGHYHQVSMNWHGYRNTIDPLLVLADQTPDGFVYREQQNDPYATEEVKPFPIISTPWQQWLEEAQAFCERGLARQYQDPFFQHVAVPMMRAWRAMKQTSEKPDRWIKAIEYMNDCLATDWQKAGVEWLARHVELYNASQQRV